MKKYFIDSNVLIDFFKKLPQATQLITKLTESGDCAISVMNVAELRSGWTKKQSKTYLPHLYNLFEITPVTREVAELAGQYRQEYKQKGISLPTIDTLIAATATIHHSCLVTRNIKHYPLSELETYKEIYK